MNAGHDSEVLLFDSGRFPWWFRIPAVGFGLLALWLALALAAHGLFGVSLGIAPSGGRSSSLFISLACLVIAALWIFIWFAQLKILFDAERHELITRGYFRSGERRMALADAKEIQIRRIRSGLASTAWRVTVEFSDGRSEQVTVLPSGIESVAAALAAATKLPVRRCDFAD